jgi:hypothetical protein
VRHKGTTNGSGTPPVALSPVDGPYAKHLQFVDQHKRGIAIWNAEWEAVWFRNLCCSKRLLGFAVGTKGYDEYDT